MIVASLLLILLAVVLLVVGLAGGSSLLLVLSIAASLLAAIALVVGARQAAAARGATRPPGASAYGPPADRDIPAQHARSSQGTTGREPPAADAPVPADPADDEPPAQDVPPEDAARLARLDRAVRVVDGRPRYHLADCPHLAGRGHEALPVAEAVELGFTPCAHCAPATALLTEAGRIPSGDAGA